MESNIFNTLSLVAFGLAALFFILAVVLFFGLGIRNVYGELHGKPTKKKVRSVSAKKNAVGEQNTDTRTTSRDTVPDEAPTILETGEIADSSLIEAYEEHTVAEFMDGLTDVADSSTTQEDFTAPAEPLRPVNLRKAPEEEPVFEPVRPVNLRKAPAADAVTAIDDNESTVTADPDFYDDDATANEDTAFTAEAPVRPFTAAVFEDDDITNDNTYEPGTENEFDEPIVRERPIANGFTLTKSVVLCNIEDVIA